MASAQTLHYPPQVGFGMGIGQTSSPASFPFKSIRITGRKKDLAWKDNRSSAFWSDVILAEVEGKLLLAKVYTQATGGERAFIHDLEVLKREQGSNAPRVYGLSNDTTTPCILFSTASLTPFSDYISELVARSDENALQRVWQLMIDMRDAGTRILAENNSVGTSSIRDAISKVHVDDQENVVITPEFGGCQVPYNGSMDEVVRFSWAAVLQREYLRPLRPLGYALDGNPSAVLNQSPREFRDSTSAANFLRQFWLPHNQRYLNWPSKLWGPFSPGDVGVFVRNPKVGTTFHKLCSISSNLGGVDIKTSVCDFDQVQPNIFRVTCNPITPDSATPSSTNFMLTWRNFVKDRDNEAAFFLANAKRIGSEHGVPPEDLVLLTKTVHGLDGKFTEDLAKSIKAPIHFYVHLDDNGSPSAQYWSFENQPCLHDKNTTQTHPDIPALPLPLIKMHFGQVPFPSQYLQVERIELDLA